MEAMRRTFVPAAGHDWALPLYDPVVALLGADRARRMLVEQAALRPGHRVLDIGCGTGTLALLIKRFYPETDVVRVNPDPKVLARGQRKAERAAISIRFDRGFSDELPYPPGSFNGCSRLSCSITSRETRRRRRCARFVASSNRAALYTWSILEGRSPVMASWLDWSIPVTT